MLRILPEKRFLPSAKTKPKTKEVGGMPSITVPFFSDFHAPFVRAALAGAGLGSVQIESGLSQKALLAGLSYANNDACYSALVSAGQAVEARCDNGTYALPLICADCRAIDAPDIVARALRGAGKSECAVVPLARFFDVSSSHALDDAACQRLAMAIVMGDVSLQAFLAQGDNVDWERALHALRTLPVEELRGFLKKFCAYANFLIAGASPRPLIAVVGTAPVLFCGGMNAGVLSRIDEEGCRAMVPHLSLFALHSLLCSGISGPFLGELKKLRALVRESGGSLACGCPSLGELRALADGLIPQGITCGAGWVLPALMLHAASLGVRDVAYLSTFGCLSGHVVGKGSLNVVRAKAADMNIASLEFDQGTSIVNQINRLKLLASMAKQRAGEAKKIGSR